jgi:hypothetical protein
MYQFFIYYFSTLQDFFIDFMFFTRQYRDVIGKKAEATDPIFSFVVSRRFQQTDSCFEHRFA